MDSEVVPSRMVLSSSGQGLQPENYAFSAITSGFVVPFPCDGRPDKYSGKTNDSIGKARYRLMIDLITLSKVNLNAADNARRFPLFSKTMRKEKQTFFSAFFSSLI